MYFTAYRMLITRAKLQAGQKVLIWGAAGRPRRVRHPALQDGRGARRGGGLLCREGRAGQEARRGGLHRPGRVQGHDAHGQASRADEEKERFKVSRAFGKRVKEILGDSPDIVFEHVGQATFPTSVFVVKPFGKVVICAGTTGYNLDFDVRYLWMRQKEILGSHFANAYECMKANELIESGQIRPVLWRTMGFDGVAEAHQLMRDNKHLGQDLDHGRRRRRERRARPARARARSTPRWVRDRPSTSRGTPTRSGATKFAAGWAPDAEAVLRFGATE